MTRLLEFDIASDSRMGGSRQHIEKMVVQITQDLRAIEAAVDAGKIEEYNFNGDDLAELDRCKSWRCRFWVKKPRTATWKLVKQTVNRTYAPAYRFV